MQFKLYIVDIVDDYKNKANKKKVEDEENKKMHAIEKQNSFNMYLVQL
jgi:hypothetical protein